jgi:ribosomal protein L37E
LTYSWLNGLKGSWDKYKEGGEQALDEHPYVLNVMKEYSKLKPKKAEKPKQDKPLKKAMTAGYGGGGSPGALSGGGVLQSEALDEGRSKLKYISCDNCGKEQVYSKHQVKCRECGHGMSFEKLYGAMRGNKK